MAQFVYTMHRVGKVVPPKRHILKNISLNKLAAEQGSLEEIIQSHDGHNLNVQLVRAADELRLPDWDAKIANLSGGERRRVELCRQQLEKPDMLLLHEPTNHLDAESVAWLERFLHDFEGTVVAITHDRYFLDNVAGWILELDRGEGIPWEGKYSSWLEQKDQRLAQEASQEAARSKSIEKELEWVRQGTDLDIETLRALENALLEFPGCAMVISHDRWFLDRIATHILDYQDEGKVEFFEGNFTEYEEYKKRTLGADALEPKRIKYKRIAK